MTHLNPTLALIQTLCLLLVIGCSSHVEVAKDDAGGAGGDTSATGGMTATGGSTGTCDTSHPECVAVNPFGSTGGMTATGGNSSNSGGTGGTLHRELCGIAIMNGCINGVITAEYGDMCRPLTVVCDNGCSVHPNVVEAYAGDDSRLVTQYIQAALCEPTADAGNGS